MTAYELMVRTNHYLIKGMPLTEGQKRTVVKQFLSEVSDPENAKRFYKSLRYPNNLDAEGRSMYPVYFIPPYNNGKKLKTLMTQLPKTHILASNAYELEILRLLHILAPEDAAVKEMICRTLERLKTTCFGYRDCAVGECFDASLLVLRFLSEVRPDDVGWIQSRIDTYRNHVAEKHRVWCTQWYYWLCLSELPDEIAMAELKRYSDDFLKQAARIEVRCNDESTREVLGCILRRCMMRVGLEVGG